MKVRMKIWLETSFLNRKKVITITKCNDDHSSANEKKWMKEQQRNMYQGKKKNISYLFYTLRRRISWSRA